MTSDLAQLGFLLFVSALVAMLTRRLHLPYTVGLVLAGMTLYFSHVYIKWHLTKDLIFSVFLPPLVFEAALFIHWRDFKKELPVVTLLATAGVVLAAAVTAVGMHYALAWDWGSAIVFGVLIAATDPVSVIATFKESKAHGRLRTLIESESLLNDGTAAVAFVAVLGVLAGGHETVLSISGVLFVTIIGGVLIGGIIAYLFMLLAGRTPDYLVEITFTTLAAYGSFFVAEHFRCSGVLAALTAGLVVGNFRSSGSISAAGRHALGPFWEYVAFVANSLDNAHVTYRPVGSFVRSIPTCNSLRASTFVWSAVLAFAISSPNRSRNCFSACRCAVLLGTGISPPAALVVGPDLRLSPGKSAPAGLAPLATACCSGDCPAAGLLEATASTGPPTGSKGSRQTRNPTMSL